MDQIESSKPTHFTPLLDYKASVKFTHVIDNSSFSPTNVYVAQVVQTLSPFFSFHLKLHLLHGVASDVKKNRTMI